MKPVTTTANAAQRTRAFFEHCVRITQRRQSQTRMDSKWIAALFVKFQVYMGNKWTSNYPSHELRTLAIEEWSRMLGGFIS